MTTRDRLILMEEIQRKNDNAWRKYATPAQPRWTWEPIQQQQNILTTTGGKLMIACCLTVALLALIVLAGA